MGSALFYLTQKIKTLETIETKRLLMLIYCELEDYVNLFELSEKILENGTKEELILELYLRATIGLKKFEEGLLFLKLIEPYPNNDLLIYFKGVILLNNNEIDSAAPIFLKLSEKYPDSVYLQMNLEKTKTIAIFNQKLQNNKDNQSDFDIQIEGKHYKAMVSNNSRLFIMNIFNFLEDLKQQNHRMQDRSFVDFIHLLLNSFNISEVDTRIAIEEFEFLASKPELRKIYNYSIDSESLSHPSSSSEMKHDQIPFWVFLMNEIYSIVDVSSNELKKFKNYIENNVSRYLASIKDETVKDENNAELFPIIAICEYFIVFESERSKNLILSTIREMPVHFRMLGFLFIIKHLKLTASEYDDVLLLFNEYCSNCESCLNSFRLLEIHDRITTIYYPLNRCMVNKSIKLIFNIIEFMEIIYYNRSHSNYLASIIKSRLDNAMKESYFDLIKKSISYGLQNDKVFNKLYYDCSDLKEIVEKILNF